MLLTGWLLASYSSEHHGRARLYICLHTAQESCRMQCPWECTRSAKLHIWCISDNGTTAALTVMLPLHHALPPAPTWSRLASPGRLEQFDDELFRSADGATDMPVMAAVAIALQVCSSVMQPHCPALPLSCRCSAARRGNKVDANLCACAAFAPLASVQCSVQSEDAQQT